MAKIDLEKVLIALLDSPFNKQFDDKVKDALKEQGLEYKDGEIVESQKPKFKVGDWVVWQNKCYKVNYNGCGYELIDQNDLSTSLEYGTVDESAYLWSIADAKDGDVLYSLDSKQSFIFKHRKPNEQAEVCCGINIYGKFFVGNTKDCIITTDKYIPATKSQRDTLFTKMKEAGYEWDAEKKELKKIEKTRPMLSDFFKAEYERGKASFANRQLYNRAILKILSDYIENYPDIRFGQILCNLGISSEAENNFYIESSKMYQNINAKLKEQENGKNRVI